MTSAQDSADPSTPGEPPEPKPWPAPQEWSPPVFDAAVDSASGSTPEPVESKPVPAEPTAEPIAQPTAQPAAEPPAPAPWVAPGTTLPSTAAAPAAQPSGPPVAPGWAAPGSYAGAPWTPAPPRPGPYPPQVRPTWPAPPNVPIQQPWQGQWRPGPRPVTYPAPARFEGVPGEPFALAILPAPRMTSGVAVGSMIAGIASILVSLAVWLFGISGADGGWGALVAGAFFVLAALLGLAGVILGILGLRNIKRGLGVIGRGYAITGIVCGGVGLVSALGALAIALLLTQ